MVIVTPGGIDMASPLTRDHDVPSSASIVSPSPAFARDLPRFLRLTRIPIAGLTNGPEMCREASQPK
jgi:hypothetical protein